MGESDAPREPRETKSDESGDLARLGAEIDRARGAQPRSGPDEQAGQNSALGAGWRISLELVVAVALCGVVGWLVDRWLDTLPWAMIAGIVLGGAAGIRNAVRAANEMEAAYLRQQTQARGTESKLGGATDKQGDDGGRGRS